MSYINANDIDHVIVAGHSLGGAAAEIFMDRHFGDSRFVGVTFGSPGELTLADRVRNDPRLINFGHSGDPVANSASVYSQGIDVSVNLRDVDDKSLGELIISDRLGGPIYEHDKIEYGLTANIIGTSKLYDNFAADPGAFSVTIGKFGGDTLGGGTGRDFLIGGQR